jgi:hypothetical protein
MPTHLLSPRLILILSFHLCLDLPGVLFPFGFLTKALNAVLFTCMRATISAHLILLDSGRYNYFFHWLYSPFGFWALIFQFHDHFTDGRTTWKGVQLVARSLPKHRTTQTQNKLIHLPNIHALCEIRSHDPGFRASEDNTCLRPLGYRDRPLLLY